MATAGCGTWYSGIEPTGRQDGAAYEEALARHSRRGWRSRGLEEIVSVTATLQTRDFLEARLAEQERLGAPSPPVLAVDGKVHEAERGISAVVFIQAPDPAWERLDRRGSAWTLFLESGGRSWEPAAIEALEGRDATILHLFPYITRFGRPWLVSFECEEVGPEPALVVTGAQAQLRLVFDLDRRG
ncbi:MAG: hypothetical protein ACOC0J_01495 [Myxococcota bacterium]